MKVVFAIVTIIVFVSYWNGPTGNRSNNMPRGADDFGRMYGATVTGTRWKREARMGQLAYQLGMNELFASLCINPVRDQYTGGKPRSMDEAITNFAWNSLVLKHEADLLQIEPMGDNVHNDPKVAEEIKRIPKFQTMDGQFDPKLEAAFVNDALPSLGFTADDLEEIAAESVRLEKLKELLKTSFVIPPGAFKAVYTAGYQKLDTSVIHFKLSDFAAKIQPTDEEIRKAFEAHLAGYYSEEKRGIELATFALSDDEKKLTGDARVAALQKISDNVEAFTTALEEKGAKFDDVAAKLKIPVTTFPPYSLAEPDPKLPKMQEVVEAAFTLTPDDPVSQPIQDEENGVYYIVKLGDIVPKKLLTLDEARPQVVAEVKNTKAQEAMGVQAREVRNKIAADMKAGKSFADAAKDEGQTVEVYPPGSLSSPDPEKEDASEVLFTADKLKEGELSEFTPMPGGGFIVHLDKREPIDPKQFEADRARIEPRFVQQQVDDVFAEWLRKQREAANIVQAQQGGGNSAPAS